MDKNKKKLIILIIAIVIVAVGIYLLSKELGILDTDTAFESETTSTSEESQVSEELGTLDTDTTLPSETTSNSEERQVIPAPDFKLEDEFGTIYSLSDFKGKYVIINFWGSWCSYCVKEMPDFQKAHETFSENGDTVILSINDTSTERSLQDALDYIHDNNFDMLVLYDLDGKVTKLYNVEGYPTTYVIDKLGNIYGYQSGSLSEQNLYDVINRLREEEQ